jgi:hypothetical protein
LNKFNNSEKKGPGRKKVVVKYNDLFKNKETGKELVKIFRKYHYTDKNNLWIGESKVKNELAIAYYVLKLPEHEFQLIKTGDKKNQLIAFYKEFGLTVAKRIEDGVYTTERNLLTEPAYGDVHDNFKSLFKQLPRYKF